jgi:broad specificity phosphatase PhoE
MKSSALLFLSFLVLAFTDCRSTKIYIVRHAEKGTLPTGNPDLTADGRNRAQHLGNLLRKKNIEAIYATETSRTRQTAEPLSLLTGVPIQSYSNDTLPKFLYRVLDAEKNALIVGHSNTVLRMLTEMNLKPGIKEIADSDYDNFFVVVMKSKDGPGGYELRLKERTYGKKSPLVTDTARQAARMQ